MLDDVFITIGFIIIYTIIIGGAVFILLYGFKGIKEKMKLIYFLGQNMFSKIYNCMKRVISKIVALKDRNRVSLNNIIKLLIILAILIFGLNFVIGKIEDYKINKCIRNLVESNKINLVGFSFITNYCKFMH